jgi:hypothetical protein
MSFNFGELNGFFSGKTLIGVCKKKECQRSKESYANFPDFVIIEIDEDDCGADNSDPFEVARMIVKYQKRIIKMR